MNIGKNYIFIFRGFCNSTLRSSYIRKVVTKTYKFTCKIICALLKIFVSLWFRLMNFVSDVRELHVYDI